jgi:hypothetical protein
MTATGRLLLLILLAVALTGCYVVPASAPVAPGVGPLPTPYVAATPQ